jgi:hypothetical protein
MLGMIKYILVALITIAGISVLSIVWPRFFKQDRPELLKQVYNLVRSTPAGNQVNDVLGVTDQIEVVPTDFKTYSLNLLSQVTNSVENQAQNLIVKQALLQLVNQYQKLTEDQKKQVQQLICQPSSKNK